MPDMQTVWGWQPALYLFLGGMGAGAFVTAAVLLLRQPLKDGTGSLRFINASMWAAALCLIIGLLLLLAELITPLRGLLLWQSFSNFSSWMTIGAWVVLFAVIVFMVTAILTAPALKVRLARRPASKLRAITLAARCFAVLGILLGLGVAAYTGILLMWVPGVPLWGSPLLPCLFTVSALDTGVALVQVSALLARKKSGSRSGARSGEYSAGWLASSGRAKPLGEGAAGAQGRGTGRDFRFLEVSVLALVLIETAVLAAYVLVMLGGNEAAALGSASYAATAVTSVRELVMGSLAPYFWVLFMAIGLGMPFIAAIVGLIRHKREPGLMMLTGPLAALVGGCTLRFCILLAGAHVDFVADAVMRLAL